MSHKVVLVGGSVVAVLVTAGAVVGVQLYRELDEKYRRWMEGRDYLRHQLGEDETE